jgi:hypothetical protein
LHGHCDFLREWEKKWRKRKKNCQQRTTSPSYKKRNVTTLPTITI